MSTRSDVGKFEADGVSDIETAREKIAQLETALHSRIIIEQAKGILAERLNVDMDTAFGILRHGARSHRMKLHELAARVVQDRMTPAPVVVAIAREARMRAGWMRERAEAQRERMEVLAKQIAEQPTARNSGDRH
jgi:hypothetical protein